LNDTFRNYLKEKFFSFVYRTRSKNKPVVLPDFGGPTIATLAGMRDFGGG